VINASLGDNHFVLSPRMRRNMYYSTERNNRRGTRERWRGSL